MRKISLNGQWRGKCISESTGFDLALSVPGSSINDLIRAGRLPEDIFYRDNASRVAEFERCDFEYERDFTLDIAEGEECVLYLEKLDTYATVFLNGEKISETKNAFIRHTFDVTDRVVAGKNTLRVYIKSPISAVDGMPQHPGAFTRDRMRTRRIQCTYGWDWVARFISCGIGNAGLEIKTKRELAVESAYIVTENIDSDSAGMMLDLKFPECYDGAIVTVRILSPEGESVYEKRRFCDEPFVRLRFDIPNARLWYPHGYGEQPIYTLAVDSESGECLHRESFGIRTVKIMQLPDAEGSEYYQKCKKIKNPNYDLNDSHSGFILKINGKRIFCHGANWVPCEPFCTGDNSQNVTRLLTLSKNYGVNMIRVWGGGDFASAHFADECSRLGILVTQDFLMACGTYPEDEDWFLEELGREAEYAAITLRNKPCLVWWSGDNENAVHGNDEMQDYTGRRSAYRGIASALYKLDPARAFLPSSPYGGYKYASNTVGTTHNTCYLGSFIFPYMMKGECADYREHFKQYRARFIAEEPQLGAISESSIRRFMTEEDVFGASDEMWNYHTKSNPAIKTTLFDMSLSFTRALLGEFTSASDRFFKLRYLQYEWIRLLMEQARREMWFSSGIIFWMLNDCWPASSGWSLMDFYGKPKDALYAFRRCSEKVLLSIDKESGVYSVVASNIGDTLENARVTLTRVKCNKVEKLSEFVGSIAAESSTALIELGIELADDEVLVAELSADGIADRTFYRNGALTLVPTEAVTMTHDAAARTVTVSAESYVHAVEFDADAIFSDNCFSLLPGESRTVSYEPMGDVGEVKLTAYTV